LPPTNIIDTLREEVKRTTITPIRERALDDGENMDSTLFRKVRIRTSFQWATPSFPVTVDIEDEISPFVSKLKEPFKAVCYGYVNLNVSQTSRLSRISFINLFRY
jgi:hypothetical protein